MTDDCTYEQWVAAKDPLLLMRGLTIRFNPVDVTAIVHQLFNGETVIGGVLRLRGFSAENGYVLNCHLIADDEVERGQLVVEPSQAEDERDELRQQAERLKAKRAAR